MSAQPTATSRGLAAQGTSPSSDSQPRRVCPLLRSPGTGGNVWRYFSLSQPGEPGMLLIILQYIDSPPGQSIIRPQMSIALKLRKASESPTPLSQSEDFPWGKYLHTSAGTKLCSLGHSFLTPIHEHPPHTHIGHPGIRRSGAPFRVYPCKEKEPLSKEPLAHVTLFKRHSHAGRLGLLGSPWNRGAGCR